MKTAVPYVEAPLGADRVLLHACCAPCSSAIIECLLHSGITPTLYYSNSNIWPRSEYDHRLSECVRYARSLGLEIVEDTWDHDDWAEFVKGLENEPERGARCLRCFRLRLRRSAEYASSHGYAVLTTTLASSRWKRQDQTDEAGTWACAEVSREHPDSPVTWWGRNWRKGGLQERRGEIVREMRFYNQLYCGCEYSRPGGLTAPVPEEPCGRPPIGPAPQVLPDVSRPD